MDSTTIGGNTLNTEELTAVADMGAAPAVDLDGAAAPRGGQTTSSGTLVEVAGVLHLVSPRSGGGFDYYRLDGKNKKWHGPLASAGSRGNIHSPVVFLARTENGCLDAIFREVAENRDVEASEASAGRLIHTHSSPYNSSSAFPWGGQRTELPEAKDIIGTPGVCPWNTSDKGLDVIAPVASGGLRHWWRDERGNPWKSSTSVGGSRRFKSCAMVKGTHKKLDVLALDQDGCLWHFLRGMLDDKWNGGTNLGSGFTGMPALVESSRSGAEYDLVVPLAEGGIGHYSLSGAWELSASNRRKFGLGRYREIGLVCTDGWLDVVARTNYDTLEHHRFDGHSWVGGTPLPKRPDQMKDGAWKVDFDTAVIGVHGAVLHTGEVLLMGMADDDESKARGSLLDTHTKTAKLLPEPISNVFCSGHAFLGNGDLLVAGGHMDNDDGLYVFAKTETGWKFREQTPKLSGGRWYPTCTTLPDGRVLILSGKTLKTDKINNSYEIYDPKSPTSPRRKYDLAQEVTGDFGPGSKTIDMYPFVYVLPDGRLFVHSRYTTRFFTPGTEKGSWGPQINAKAPLSRTYPMQGASVLLPLKPDNQGNYSAARVAIFGGGGKEDAGTDTPACNSVELMDTGAAKPEWVFGKPLNQGRVMPDAVLLPNGSVLIVSGSRAGLAGNNTGSAARQPELSAEIYDPEADSFTRLAPMHTPRLYHASAVLLPDATVLVTGKCKLFNPEPYRYAEHRGEVFTPPYLRTQNPRPVIAAAPDTIESGGATIVIEVAGVAPADIKRVVLIRPSTATHSINMDQRAVELTPPTVSGRTITVRAPGSNWVLPPGYYMLFLISRDGVPSTAKFVQVKVFPG